MNKLINSRVNIVAIVDRITGDMNGVGRIVLKDLHVNGEYAKDHAWIKMTKAFRGIKTGDMFTATALVYEYMDSSDINRAKTGLKTIRSVQKIAEMQKG